MKRIIPILLIIAIVLTACSGGDKTAGKEEGNNPQVAMGQINTAYATELETLNYLKTSNSENIQLAYLTIDSLVEFNEYGVMIPSAAVSYTVSEDGVKYTFKLREGVHWYTHEGKEYAEVVADDFVAALEWVLTKENSSTTANTAYNVIKNAKEFYDGDIKDFSQVGIKAIDKYTLEYTLIEPAPYFLKQLHALCFYPVNRQFLEEAGENFGTSNDTLLYSGAYIIAKYEPDDRRVLQYNENYWNKDIISVDKITYKYNKESNAIGHELFLRGEINEVAIPGSILDDWMNNPEKKEMLRPHNLTNMTYFMGLNFEPKYEEEYAPKDWETAVNNKNFRKALFHGLDRVGAISVTNPYDANRILANTIVRTDLVNVDGVDYTMLDSIKKFTETESFNKELALEYKNKAVEELQGKVGFPIKIVFPYSTASAEVTNRAQVIEQQLEKLLGNDFIDVILIGYPSTGFNNEVRNPGKFSILLTGWGPDYMDPMGCMDFFLSDVLGDKAMRIHLAKDYIEANGKGKFENMIYKANDEKLDVEKRYNMFAEAEAFLLEEAFTIPLYRSGGGYKASYIDPFTQYRSQGGLSSLAKFKAGKILEKPMTTEEYERREVEFYKEAQEAQKNSEF